jgi:hypothetical protein
MKGHFREPMTGPADDLHERFGERALAGRSVTTTSDRYPADCSAVDPFASMQMAELHPGRSRHRPRRRLARADPVGRPPLVERNRPCFTRCCEPTKPTSRSGGGGPPVGRAEEVGGPHPGQARRRRGRRFALRRSPCVGRVPGPGGGLGHRRRWHCLDANSPQWSRAQMNAF